MVIAVALIKVVPGKEKPVYHALKNIGVTRSLYHIFGDHDFLIILEAESKGELALIVDQVKEIEGVAAADTVLMGKEGCLEKRRYLQAPILSTGLV